jgi:hypothetical protein
MNMANKTCFYITFNKISLNQNLANLQAAVTDTYRYVQIRTDTYRYVQIRIDTYRYVQIRTNTYSQIPWDKKSKSSEPLS